MPSPEAADPSDVSVALEAARALWEKADTDEALRWFSRAAEAAEQAGNDRRALELARAVADLKDTLAANADAIRIAPSPKPPAPSSPPPARKSSLPPTPPSMRPRPPDAVARSGARPPSVLPRAPEVAKAPPSVRPRPPEAKAAAPAVSSPGSQAKLPEETPVPAKVEKAAPAPIPAAPERKPGSLTPLAAKVAPAAPPATPNASRARAPSEQTPLAAKLEQPAASLASAPTKAEIPGEERLRVSVKSSVRDPELLLVRILRKGQPVPHGCHEGYLSPAEHGVDLRMAPE